MPTSSRQHGPPADAPTPQTRDEIVSRLREIGNRLGGMPQSPESFAQLIAERDALRAKLDAEPPRVA